MSTVLEQFTLEQQLRSRIMIYKTAEQHVTELYELIQAKESLEKQIKAKREEVTIYLKSEGLDEAYNKEGVGFQVYNTPERYKFGKPVLEYLEKNSLLRHFIEPKVSKTRLEALAKEGLIDFHTIQDCLDLADVTYGEVSVKRITKKQEVEA